MPVKGACVGIHEYLRLNFFCDLNRRSEWDEKRKLNTPERDIISSVVFGIAGATRGGRFCVSISGGGDVLVVPNSKKGFGLACVNLWAVLSEVLW